MRYLRKYDGSSLMTQKTGDGALVVKSLGIVSGCLVLNPGPATYCVTLGKSLICAFLICKRGERVFGG